MDLDTYINNHAERFRQWAHSEAMERTAGSGFHWQARQIENDLCIGEDSLQVKIMGRCLEKK